MKILFVENDNITLHSFREELLDSLISDGHEIGLVGDFSDQTIAKYEKSTTVYRIKTNLKSRNVFKNLFLKYQYKKIISSFKPNLILTFTIKPNIYCNLVKKDGIVSIANITGLGTAFNRNDLLKYLVVHLYKKSMKKVDHVMFQNENGLIQFKELGFKINSYSFIPGSGVNEEKFSLEKLDDHEGIKFLYPSRFIKEKGFNLLLEAIPKVLEKCPNCSFTFLGKSDKNANKQIKEALSKNNLNSEFITFADNVHEYYKKCDFVVSPSYYHEGISNVLLEALATGRPIITTNDNYGCKEVLEEGINGYGVKSKDLDSLVNALIKAAETPKDRIFEMGKAGRDFVVKNFNRNQTIAIYKNTISKLL